MAEWYTSVHRIKNDIAVRGYRDGKRFQELVPKWQPTFYIQSNAPTGWKTLDGKNVGHIQPGNMYECGAWIKKYADVDNFKIYGNTNYPAQYISDTWVDGIEYDLNLIKIFSLDIECVAEGAFPEPALAANPINAITIHDIRADHFYVWGLPPDNKSHYKPTAKNITYVECGCEKDLLHLFLSFWKLHTPDVVTGWNIKLFDMPYIINRLERILGQEYAAMISPWGEIVPKTLEIAGKEVGCYEFTGVQQLDFMDLFKKFGYEYGTQESYKLDNIATVVLGEKKLEYEGTIYNFYVTDYPRFMEYNIHDTALVSRLEQKTGLISLAISLAYKALVNYQVVFGPVVLWDTLLYNEMRRRKIVVPPAPKNFKDGQIRGAHVKEPIIGLHEWVISIDAASLYPHLMMQYNMSPETIVNHMIPGVTVDSLLAGVVPEIPEGMCMTAIGQCFKTDKQGIIPSIIEKMYAERSTIKKKMLAAKQSLEQVEAELKSRGIKT